jgi:beta-lactamase class A
MKNFVSDSPQQKKHNFTLVFLILLMVLFICLEIFDYIQTKNWRESHHNDRSIAGLDLINPEVVKNKLSDTGMELRAELSQVIGDLKSENKVVDVSVYFRDLDSGYGFGVNENEKFIPASLLKMISMISYYKLSESNPGILEETIVYKGMNYNSQQTFQPTEEMVVGQSYSVDELIKKSVSYSDNNANAMLIEHIDASEYRKIFTELGVEFSVSSSDKSITPKIYANLFRILYNATFLNKENSQKALKLLVESNFTDGLQAGLNGNIKLANKFGERISEENGKQILYLHDCGIVYTKHPYVLCAMTKGENLEVLQEILAQISSLVYKKMKY